MPDSVALGLSLFLRGVACIGSATSVLGAATSELSLFLQSASCAEFVLPVLEFVSL